MPYPFQQKANKKNHADGSAPLVENPHLNSSDSDLGFSLEGYRHIEEITQKHMLSWGSNSSQAAQAGTVKITFIFHIKSTSKHASIFMKPGIDYLEC
jgi:hypothetical protein